MLSVQILHRSHSNLYCYIAEEDLKPANRSKILNQLLARPPWLSKGMSAWSSRLLAKRLKPPWWLNRQAAASQDRLWLLLWTKPTTMHETLINMVLERTKLKTQVPRKSGVYSWKQSPGTAQSLKQQLPFDQMPLVAILRPPALTNSNTSTICAFFFLHSMSLVVQSPEFLSYAKLIWKQDWVFNKVR